MARDGHRGGRLVLQGCDTSVLLVNAPGIDSELNGLGNLGIQGQEIVYNIKAAVEAECPGVVSCADILALASQVSVFLQGGHSWKVLLGRRDGTTANRTGADNLPSPFETLEPLKRKNLWIWKIEIHTSACSKSIEKFKIVKEEEGLSRDDLVVVEEDSKLQTYASTKTVLCECPINMQKQNYTIITSKCKRPGYPASLCCEALLEFCCGFVDEVNDMSTNCAEMMFYYINRYGKYPVGLFFNKCKEGPEGLSCQKVLQAQA